MLRRCRAEAQNKAPHALHLHFAEGLRAAQTRQREPEGAAKQKMQVAMHRPSAGKAGRGADQTA